MAMTRADTLSLAECAAAYGRSLDWFYRHWRDLVAHHGMPDRVASCGHPRFPRARFLSWVAGVLPRPAANDVAPTAEPTIEQHQADLAREYRRTA